MGDIADMIMDGTLCSQCSSFIDDSEGLGEAFGVPRLCRSCGGPPESGGVPTPTCVNRGLKKHKCHCGKRFRTEQGLADHSRVVHASG